MKTNNIFSVLFAVVMTIVAFSSCNFIDDRSGYYPTKSSDKYESSTLSGQWTGNFGMYYTNRNTGITYNTYKTDIVFYSDYAGATSGWGRQVDSYDYGPYKSIQHKIYWNITNGYIYLNYSNEPNMNCYIYNYSMTNNDFSGYFSNGKQRFSMRKLNSNYNWGIYTSDYSRIPNSGFGISISFTRANTEQADVEETPITSYEEAQADCDIVYGNHFCETAE